MKTQDLINAIAQDAGAPRPALGARIATALGVGGAIAIAMLLATLGVRPDIAEALQTWRFDVKLLATACACVAALLATRELIRPDAIGQRAALAFLLPLGVMAIAIAAELAGSDASTWAPRAIGSNSRLCLTAIIAFAAGPLVALLIALRAGAPRSPALAGAVAGLLAGSVGAFLYATHCVDDSPLFVALWYIPPIIFVGLVGALAGRWCLRW